MKTKVQNPGYKVGENALLVMYRHNPQLGCYATISVEKVVKLTSASAVINNWNDDPCEFYRFDDFSRRDEDGYGGYGYCRHYLLPKDKAIEWLKEVNEDGYFKQYRVSGFRNQHFREVIKAFK